MTRPMPGGRRRVDRVLADDFMVGIPELSLPELRERRKEAEQEEADLSFLRRMLHGRIDIVRAEQRRREPSSDGVAVVDELPAIFAEERTTRGLGRFMHVEPSRVDEHRRDVEALVADAVISDVSHRTDVELARALVSLRAHESDVSDVRRQVQQVVDALTAELAGRYRDGGASVDELLAGGSGS
ncbi:MAG: aerial mycelium formation protein [Candidatus Nanopelagicales bacterium]